LSIGNQLKTFLHQNWFLILLVAALVVGNVFHDMLAALAAVVGVKDVIVFVVMLMTALPLELKQFVQVVKRPAGPLIASSINMFLIPLACYLGGWIWLDKPTFLGLLSVGATPCTLASAAVWTRKANGNDAIALAVTVITNATCFLVTPALILWLAGSFLEMDTWKFATRLGVLVVLPLLLAQVARGSSWIADLATSQKTTLGCLSQLGILSIVFLSSIMMGGRIQSGELQLGVWQIISVVCVCSGIHVAALFGGYYSAIILNFSLPDAIAIGLSSSQKTLMVGILISVDLGFSILPIIVYHSCQLIIDTLFAQKFKFVETDEDSV